MPESSCMAFRTSCVENARDSSVARMIALRSVSCVRPKMAPRACMSQYGVPKPAKAGTTTRDGFGFFSASSWAIEDDRATSSRISIPSRSHCKAAPATNTLPSSAYVVTPSICHATVFRRPEGVSGIWDPVFMSIKHPVP